MSSAGDGFGDLFRNFARSAFRLETRQVYRIVREQARIARFLAGEPKPEADEAQAAWHSLVRTNIACGKSMQRVRLIRRPMTEYVRYGLSWSIPANIEAGESYRILDVTERTPDLPNQDFWMFDDSTVLLLHYHDDGSFLGRTLAEPNEIERYVQWSTIAVKESVPFGEYRA
ncbi:DUF6879 family protein [Actinokineospora sp.]|uniref:DUF6879 family protein n=1 Tax=Actinokineospora sp. TaxID=1872133 RepID=UPI004037C6AB